MNQAIGALRIVVADDERETRDFYQELLQRLGHQVIGTASSGAQLVELCRAMRPDVVITDIKMPDMDGIEAAARANKHHQAPIILVSAHHDAELIVRAGTEYIMAYLIKPVKEADLMAAIALAVMRFEHFQKLVKEAASLRQALEDRKIIERAKGILMKRAHMEEPDAFRRLQKMASERNKKLVEIADIIVTAEEALQPMARN